MVRDRRYDDGTADGSNHKAAIYELCAATFAARAAEQFWPEGPAQYS